MHQSSFATYQLGDREYLEKSPFHLTSPASHDHAESRDKFIRLTLLMNHYEHITALFNMNRCMFVGMVYQTGLTLKDDAEAVERLVAEVRECIDPWRRRLFSLP